MLTKSGDGFDFVFGKGSGLIGGADKAGNALGGANSQPGVVGDDHADKHIAGEEFFFNGGFFALVDLDFFLGGDEDLVDKVLKTHGLNSGFEGDENAVFVAGLGVNDVPLGRSGSFGGDDDVIGILYFGYKLVDLFGFFFF